MQLNQTEIQILIEKALCARENAYAPYSSFWVGAALLTVGGNIYMGCNIENSSYPAGICAERTAFAKAVSEGEREFCAIAIAGYKNNEEPGTFCYPCGICRQFMAEFCKPDFQVISVKSREEYEIHTLGELIPCSFSI